MGRSRGGLTSKIHALVDPNGLPVRLAVTPGEAHDNRLAGKLLSRLTAGSEGAWANIPPKSNRNKPICFSPYLYRARNLVERFFNRIKQCRRVATRYGKLHVSDNDKQASLRPLPRQHAHSECFQLET
jgi:transposase